MRTKNNIIDKHLRIESYMIFQLFFSIFCALFGAVYEYFSHEVYSFYMIYSFMIPLILGVAIPILMLKQNQKGISSFTIRTWNYGIITLTVGCIFKGVLEIYGTTNRLISVYFISSFILLLVAGISYIVRRKNARASHFKDTILETTCRE